MLLTYLDESYRKGAEYWLGAAMVDETMVHRLSRDVRASTARIPHKFGIAHDVELHGYDIFHGERVFRPIKAAGETGVLIGLLRAGLRALADAKPEIAFVGVEWSSDPTITVEEHRMLAFETLLTILEQRSRARDQRCLLIADREETTERSVRDAVRLHQDRTQGNHNDCRIIENALFVGSQDSPGVQAVDLATFCFHRRRGGLDADPRAIPSRSRKPLDSPRAQMHEEPR